MAVKGNIYSQEGPQEYKQGGYLYICTHKLTSCMLRTEPQFLFPKKPPWKPRAHVHAFGQVSLQLLREICLRLTGTQQEPVFNLAPLQSKEWHLQWHLPKKSLGRQSISEMLRHNFLPVSHLLPNATNLLQAYISIELLPCQHKLRWSSQSVKK